MAAESEAGGGGPSLNWSGLLALITLAGSVWLVSHRLASERPVAPAGATRPFIGEQTLEARLWEDPLKSSTDGRPESDGPNPVQPLRDQIVERDKTNTPVLLLPVLLSGGHFGEDRESRIRSRFAIGSALSVSGYAPEDAEHIGMLTIAWPGAHELDEAKSRRLKLTNEVTSLWQAVRESADRTTNSMDLRYEWYRARDFYRGPHAESSQRTNVLVLWLDESFFEDEPLLRLPLLLQPLMGADDSNSAVVPVALIGPRRSLTLRAMVKRSGGAKLRLTSVTNFWNTASNVLKHVSVYCATPSAMDEVLVTNQPSNYPREAVKSRMTNVFGGFRNFAATDAQLAEQVIDELKLRGVDLKRSKEHMVLISESDTFYGRVLALTYEAALAVRQHKAPNLLPFVQGYVQSTNSQVTNFHSFRYLRGLDGEVIGGEAGVKSQADHGPGEKPQLTSIEELRNWIPDENRAEGQAQFDYLGRLGDQIDELEKELHRRELGSIRAIGVVGSDVYDTLLILQALRRRFPGVLFFTTDLDARFSDAREHDWARNLIVASAYGLKLHPSLQAGVAAFRDSTQTAQFAAGLAALGLLGPEMTNLPPRRFEIGNRTAVDISVTEPPLRPSEDGIHPLTPGEEYHESNPTDTRRHLWFWITLLVAVVAAVCWFWTPLRRMTYQGKAFIHERPEPLNKATDPTKPSADGAEETRSDVSQAAAEIEAFRATRLKWFWGGAVAFVAGAVALGAIIWHETFWNPGGEQFSLTNGTSAWPAEILRFLVCAGSLATIFGQFQRNRETFRLLSLDYHLPNATAPCGESRTEWGEQWLMFFRRATAPRLPAGISMAELWREYSENASLSRRATRVIIPMVVYMAVGCLVFAISDQVLFNPIRGFVARICDFVLVTAAALSFVVLTLFTIDAALLCRWFIFGLAHGGVEFPVPARRHFAARLGGVSEEHVDEWIRIRLIADLTDRISRLVYYPIWLLLLLLIARNSWWDSWTWPAPLVLIFALNLGLALASLAILQNAARQAKGEAEQSLSAKLGKLRARATSEAERKSAKQIKGVLDEIVKLRRGAFVSFWENPIVGAVFLSSGGVTALQLLIWAMGR